MRVLFIFLLISFSSSAQWTKGRLVDNFGDSIGSIDVYKNQGIFSNSATNKDVATLEITYYKDKRFLFEILEYNRYPATFLTSGMKISFKLENNEVFESYLFKNDTYVVGNYTYGDKYFYIDKPKEKYLKRLSKKGQTHLFTLIESYDGILKMNLVTESSNYNFDIHGFSTTQN